MKDKQILPELDLKKIQVAANEAALKGAISVIDEHYNGWKSPFKKEIEEQLANNKLKLGITLPNIIGLINDSLSNEIDRIANAAIAKSYIPLVKELLGVEKAKINFSDFLKKFIDCVDAENIDDCEVEVTNDEGYNWLNIEIESSRKKYQITFHVFHCLDKKEEEQTTYQILSLPNKDRFINETMTLKIDKGSLELPFYSSILSDKFTSYLASLILANTEIVMDTRYFDEDMFTEECHCY